MMRQPGKYGVRFSTIRYFQSRADDARLMYGVRLVGCLSDPVMGSYNPRMIGHDAIAAAYVRTPDQMRRLLERGER
jgi:hypothetical protein